MKYTYQIKNRIIIGNRKDCDFYIKYVKPIYLYPTGIKNPFNQKIIVNGIVVTDDYGCTIGDYIEIASFSFRYKEDCIQSSVKSASLHLYDYDEVRYDEFIPIVWDATLLSKTVVIEGFKEKIEKDSFFSQWISVGINLGISLIMFYFIPNAFYMLFMIFGNSMMVLSQYLIFRKNNKVKLRKYLKKKEEYDGYIFEIQKELNDYFKNIEKYEQGFSLTNRTNLFSRKKKSKDYFMVDLGYKNQNLIQFQYQIQEGYPAVNQMVEYYRNWKMINRISLNRKMRIQYNHYLLDTLIAKLIYFHSHEEIKIKCIGNFNYTGNHFEKISILDVIEDDSLYLLDRYYKEIEHLNLNCIVLSDEHYDFYDEVLIEKENKVYIATQNLEVNLDKIDFKKINQYVNNFHLKKIGTRYQNYDLFDVHQGTMWGKYDACERIIAYLNPECIVDFHESKDGPHALVAGMTGSGKSELMQSLVMSLCILYSPSQIQIVVIDYKGSSFASKIEALPHVIGVINNLNEDLNRCIDILKLEIKQRQIYFKEREISHINESDLSHLFIVCDEFAELKRERSDFIDELISISRIGRSLGVHLILATQKPSGIVSEEILNNANLKIALKLLDRNESVQLIGDDSAIHLKSSGEFVMKSNVSYYRGKSMYINKIASIENQNRIIVNQTKVINDHEYFDYTQREYFISKMPKNTINIFESLPMVQNNCFLMIDYLSYFKEESFTLRNTVIYGDVQTGKTKTLETMISQIQEGVVYYIYEDCPLMYQKVISISMADYDTIKRLFYRLEYQNLEKVTVVIDHFDLFTQFDFYDRVEKLIKNSTKNAITFIVSMYQELNYFLQIYFGIKYVLYYEMPKRKELNSGFSFYNKKIAGRVWIKNRQGQLGTELESYDYMVDSKYQLHFRDLIWKENQYGYEFYSLSPFVLKDEVAIIYYHQDKLEKYLSLLVKGSFKVINIKEINSYDLNRIEHKIFLDEYSITVGGDFSSEIEEDEVIYVGLRKKIKLKI